MVEPNPGRGRGRSNRGRGGRGRSGRWNNAQSTKTKKTSVPEDAESELGDNIYLINQSNQADKFVKTTEAILTYIQKTYKSGEDIKKALKEEAEFDFDKVKPTIKGGKDWYNYSRWFWVQVKDGEPL